MSFYRRFILCFDVDAATPHTSLLSFFLFLPFVPSLFSFTIYHQSVFFFFFPLDFATFFFHQYSIVFVVCPGMYAEGQAATLVEQMPRNSSASSRTRAMVLANAKIAWRRENDPVVMPTGC